MNLPAEASSNLNNGAAREFVMVLLAGALHPSPLRQALDISVLCLPVSERESVLDLWLRACMNTSRCRGVTIALSSEHDARDVERQVASSVLASQIQDSFPITIALDAEECRGPGGVLLEHTRLASLEEHMLVLVAEASCIPPANFGGMMAEIDDEVVGLVGGTSRYEPAGVYAFTSEAIALLPQVAYLDIKEQVLPHLYRSGKVVRPIVVTDRATSLRTRRQYLNALSHLRRISCEESAQNPTDTTSIAPSARIVHPSLIAEGAVVDEGAVVYQSVILPGARCSAGSVVARSIVGHDAEVSPGASVVDRVIDRCSERRPVPSKATASKRMRQIDFRSAVSETLNEGVFR